MEKSIKELFIQYKSLSLADCSLILLSQIYDIGIIHSFDKGFNKINSLKLIN